MRRARRRRVRRKNGGVIALPAAALLAPATVQVLPRARVAQAQAPAVKRSQEP